MFILGPSSPGEMELGKEESPVLLIIFIYLFNSIYILLNESSIVSFDI